MVARARSHSHVPSLNAAKTQQSRQEREAEGLRAALRIRQDPGLWLTTCGAISGRAPGEYLQYPDLHLNRFQQEVVAIYRYCMEHDLPCRIIILKPRQEGSSTISTAILYSHLRNYKGNGLIIAHEKATTDLLSNIWNRYCDTDTFGQWGSRPDKSRRKFSNGSALHLETANDPNAGRGGTWHGILATEVAYYRTGGKASGEAVFESMLNGIHLVPKTLVILESTPNGMEGVYYDTYQGAVSFEDFKKGKVGNGYIKVFYPWYAFEDTKKPQSPEEQKAVMNSLDDWERQLYARWGDQVTPEHFAWRRQKLTMPPYLHDPAKFNVDYPPDDESCWRTSGSFRFDAAGLADLDLSALQADASLRIGILDDGREVLDVPNLKKGVIFEQTARNEAWYREWEPPIEGLRYLVSADFMTGEQAIGAADPDCHAVGVWRHAFTDVEGDLWVPKMVAAINPECRVDVDVICVWIGLMARRYGGCLVVPEINNSNGLVSLLRKQGCTIYHRRKSPENTPVGTGRTFRVPGWNTTTSTRPQMINSLAARVREQEWSVPCERARKEYRMFMTYPNGDVKAAPRHHDDWVMMSAMASMTLDHATLYTASPSVPAMHSNQSSGL